MNNRSVRLVILILGLALLLVACAGRNDATATPDGEAELAKEPLATATPNPTATPTAEPTETPTATAEPTATIEPTAPAEPAAAEEPISLTPPAVQTMEAILRPPEFVLGELESYAAEFSGLTFDYPAGWVVTEDETTGVRIESKAGIGDQMPDADGASMAIIPMAADNLEGETLIEKLATFIVSNGMPPTSRLGQPSSATLNGQELLFSAFVDTTDSVEGIYALYSVGDQLAVVFAVAGGESRVSYRPAVETIVNSIILTQTE